MIKHFERILGIHIYKQYIVLICSCRFKYSALGQIKYTSLFHITFNIIIICSSNNFSPCVSTWQLLPSRYLQLTNIFSGVDNNIFVCFTNIIMYIFVVCLYICMYAVILINNERKSNSVLKGNQSKLIKRNFRKFCKTYVNLSIKKNL